MPDREKVMRGLELCAGTDCIGCPYRGVSPCQNKLAKDALVLLKEREPRVMTLEEIEQRNGEFNPDPVFVEWRSGYMQWVLESIGAVACAVRSEGKFVRAWTSRPSEQQMRETKWEEEQINVF